MTSSTDGVRVYARTRPNDSPSVIAHDFVAALSHDEIIQLAVAGARAAIVGDRRRTARIVEVGATRKKQVALPPQQWRDNPDTYPHPIAPLVYAPPSKRATPEARAAYDIEFDERTAMHDWARTTSDGREWIERAATMHNVPLVDALHSFGRVEDAMRLRLDAILADEADRINIEALALVSTSFALPDGACVTWGAATIEQHESRIDQLLTLATMNMSTAARHRAAVQMIREANVTTLAEVAHEVNV